MLITSMQCSRSVCFQRRFKSQRFMVTINSTSSAQSKFDSASNMKSYLSPTKSFGLDNLLISKAFSMFNLTIQLDRSSHIITLQRPSARSRLKVTDRSFTHHAPVGLRWNSLPKQLRYPTVSYGILRRLHHSALLLILLLYSPCTRMSFTLNSKLSSLNNHVLLSLVCTNSCRFSGPLT